MNSILPLQTKVNGKIVPGVKMPVEQQVSTYLSLIHSPNDRIALCLIRGQRPNEEVQHRFVAVTEVAKLIPWLKWMNVQGWNVYVTPSTLRPNASNRKKESFLDQQDVIYIEADCRDAMDQVRKRYPYPCLVVKTSVGHYHIYWRLSERIPVCQQESLMKVMVKDIGSDPAAVDVSRVLRLPGFWHKVKGNTVDIVFQRKERTSYKSLLESSSPQFKGQTFHTSPPPSPHRACLSIMKGQVEETPIRNTYRVSRFTSSEGLVVEEAQILGAHFKSESHRDWALVHAWLRHGLDPEECIRRLEERRRGEKHPGYARYTVQEALQGYGGNRGAGGYLDWIAKYSSSGGEVRKGC